MKKWDVLLAVGGAVEWSFQATNLATGETVPVNVGTGRKAASNEVVVELAPGTAPEGVANVTFPKGAAGTVHELAAGLGLLLRRRTRRA
jgi:hypothetical protein